MRHENSKKLGIGFGFGFLEDLTEEASCSSSSNDEDVDEGVDVEDNILINSIDKISMLFIYKDK